MYVSRCMRVYMHVVHTYSTYIHKLNVQATYYRWYTTTATRVHVLAGTKHIRHNNAYEEQSLKCNGCWHLHAYACLSAVWQGKYPDYGRGRRSPITRICIRIFRVPFPLTQICFGCFGCFASFSIV